MPKSSSRRAQRNIHASRPKKAQPCLVSRKALEIVLNSRRWRFRQARQDRVGKHQKCGTLAFAVVAEPDMRRTCRWNSICSACTTRCPFSSPVPSRPSSVPAGLPAPAPSTTATPSRPARWRWREREYRQFWAMMARRGRRAWVSARLADSINTATSSSAMPMMPEPALRPDRKHPGIDQLLPGGAGLSAIHRRLRRVAAGIAAVGERAANVPRAGSLSACTTRENPDCHRLPRHRVFRTSVTCSDHSRLRIHVIFRIR